MRYKIVACLVVIGIVAVSCNSKENAAKPDVLAKNVDSAINPADDFFDYANGFWIKNNPIPADESAWGLFQIIPNETLERIRDINLEVSKTSHGEGTAEQKIGDFWKAANDSVKIEQSGIQPLQPYLAKIDAINNGVSLQNTMAQLDAMGVNGAIGFFVGQDAKNSKLEVLQLWQTGLGLPEREFYFKSDSTSVAIRNAYVENITKMLTLLGADSLKAFVSAKNILALEAQLAKASRRLEDLRNPYANYHKYAVNELNKVSSNINWKDYMSVIGAKNTDSIIIGQPEYYTAAGIALSGSLDTWKDYLRRPVGTRSHGSRSLQVARRHSFCHAVKSSWDALGARCRSPCSTEYSPSTSSTATAPKNGATERRPKWKRIISSEQNVMGELLGQIYVKKYFNDSAKARYTKLVENIRTALKNRIENLDWMSDSTKQKALAKLAAVNKKVGYPDKWKDFSSLKITPDSYFQNLVNANVFWHNYNINKLGKPVDKTEWDMYPQTYNASYDPSNNEIVLPAAAFIIPGYSDAELDDAVVYGYMAASTIGHELTHGFDDEGRQYDADGNFQWVTRFGSTDTLMKAGCVAQTISLDALENIYVVGTFSGWTYKMNCWKSGIQNPLKSANSELESGNRK